MKLRFRDDSIRIRLTRSEVARLASGAGVTASTRFGPDSALRYSVLPGGEQISAHFDRGLITVRVPADQAAEWAGGNEIVLAGEQKSEDLCLRITIEKDLECANPRPGEDNSDAFPATLGRVHCV